MRFTGLGTRRLGIAVLGLATVCAALVGGTTAQAVGARRAAGSATVTDITDFDSYVCTQPGFVGFENFATGTSLSTGTVSGLSFSTNNSTSWTVGDFASGPNDGDKFPAGPYTSEQTHFTRAAGVTTATIAFTDGPASRFSVLVSDYSRARLEAFDGHGNLLAKTPAHKVPDGRHMGQFQVAEPTAKIAFVSLVVNDAKFAVDSICTDAPEVPTPQVTLTTTDGPPKANTTVEGAGFGANERIDIKLNNVFNGSVQTHPDGSFSRPLQISPTAAPGAATIVATGSDSGLQGTANFFVHTDWPQIGFNPGRNAFNPVENQIGPGNVASLHSAWGSDGGVTGGRPNAPVVVDGVVYASSADGAVYAFNDETGATLWSCVPGSPPCATGGQAHPRPARPVALRGAPSYDGGRLFVASADGKVYALDPANGDPIWRYATGRALNRAPLVDDGIVYVGSDSGSVYALRESDGSLVWRRDLGTPVHSTLATDGTRLFFGTDSGKFFALQVTNGKTAWKGSTGQQIRSSPAFAKGAVFVGSADGNVYAWQASTGTPLWTTPTGQPVGAAIAAGQDDVYVGLENGQFVELSASTGDILKSYNTGASITSRAADANSVVYVASSSQRLYAFDQGTFDELLPTPIPVGSSPTEITVTNGAVYLGSNDNRIYKFVP